MTIVGGFLADEEVGFKKHPSGINRAIQSGNLEERSGFNPGLLHIIEDYRRGSGIHADNNGVRRDADRSKIQGSSEAQLTGHRFPGDKEGSIDISEIGKSIAQAQGGILDEEGEILFTVGPDSLLKLEGSAQFLSSNHHFDVIGPEAKEW